MTATVNRKQLPWTYWPIVAIWVLLWCGIAVPAAHYELGNAYIGVLTVLAIVLVYETWRHRRWRRT